MLYLSNFTDEKNEAQRVDVTCPRWGLNSGLPGSNAFDYDIESLQSLIAPGQIADNGVIDLGGGGQGGRGQKSEQGSWGTMAQSDLRDSVEAKGRASGGTSGILSAGLAQAKAWR